jgi:hypothetical protein
MGLQAAAGAHLGALGEALLVALRLDTSCVAAAHCRTLAASPWDRPSDQPPALHHHHHHNNNNNTQQLSERVILLVSLLAQQSTCKTRQE